MKKLIIIGAGGHAKVVIDILKDNKEYKIEGCISKGSDNVLPSLIKKGIKNAFVAIGDNKRRLELSKKVKALGFKLVNVISKHSTISKSSRLGSGIVIMPGVVVNVGSVIEDLAIVNTRASIDHDCFIGEASHIAPGSSLAGNVRIDKGAFLGTGAVVIPGMQVGSWSTIGAGGVVIRDIPSYSVAVGNPAKVIKKINHK